MATTRPLSEINIHDGGGDPVVLAPPTDMDVTAFARETGRRIPGSYIRLLRQVNGGTRKHPRWISVQWASGQ